MAVQSANTSHNCRTGNCVVEDVIALLVEVLELLIGAGVSKRRQGDRIWIAQYRIFEMGVEHRFGNTVPAGEARFEGSVQNTDTSLSAPSATTT